MEDQGHENLMQDLGDIINLADAYEFHDFKNREFATPKVELYKRFIALADNVKKGRYDN